MKNLYSFLIAATLTASSLAAQTVITSVANGNATSPFTWSCTCIPMDGDSITINHNVTLDVDYAYTMGGIRISPSGTVTGNSGARIFGVSGGYFVNDGTMTMGYVAHNGGSFVNNATLAVTSSMLIDQGVTTVNNGSIAVGDSTYINTACTLNSVGNISAATFLSAGTITTSGGFISDDLLNVGTFNGMGPVTCNGSFYNTGNVTLNVSGSVSGDIWNAENFTVNSYFIAQTLYNGDTINGTATFTNNGTLSLQNSFFNSEDVNGSGDFCVVDSTLNSGAITGTVDICDQTGGGWDLNIGTEAGTVTHCATGPCTIGIPETPITTIGISPNPSNEIIRLQLPKAEIGVVEVIDITGRVVMREDVNGKEMLLNVLQLPEGMYSVVVRGEKQNYCGRFIKQ